MQECTPVISLSYEAHHLNTTYFVQLPNWLQVDPNPRVSGEIFIFNALYMTKKYRKMQQEKGDLLFNTIKAQHKVKKLSSRVYKSHQCIPEHITHAFD